MAFTVLTANGVSALAKPLIGKISPSPVVKGYKIVLQSGCYKCHSFVKGKRIDNIVSLARWGDRHLTIKETEKAIRSCKMDPYCSQIPTDKQVEYVSYYLNSLK
ncbi:MAG: hypothetical protein ACYCS0_00935 [bacterium]